MQATERSLNKTLAAACLLSGLAAAPAPAAYLGALKRNTTVQMEFTNQNLDKLAVTVLLINRRDDLSRAVPYTIPAAVDGDDGIETIPVTIGERIVRVILLVDQPGGGHCVLRIDGGPGIHMDGDARVTFDTEP
jgi:hypothetical protein